MSNLSVKAINGLILRNNAIKRPGEGGEEDCCELLADEKEESIFELKLSDGKTLTPHDTTSGVRPRK